MKKSIVNRDSNVYLLLHCSIALLLIRTNYVNEPSILKVVTSIIISYRSVFVLY